MKVELDKHYVNRGGYSVKVINFRGHGFHYSYDVECMGKTYPVSDEGYFHSASEPHENDLTKACDA